MTDTRTFTTLYGDEIPGEGLAPRTREAIVHTFQEAIKQLPAHQRFSDAEIEGLYAAAYSCYSQADFEKAAQLLFLTALYRPFEPRYVKAQAMALQRCGRWQQAVEAYARALALVPDDAQCRAGREKCARLIDSKGGRPDQNS